MVGIRCLLYWSTNATLLSVLNHGNVNLILCSRLNDVIFIDVSSRLCRLRQQLYPGQLHQDAHHDQDKLEMLVLQPPEEGDWTAGTSSRFHQVGIPSLFSFHTKLF